MKAAYYYGIGDMRLEETPVPDIAEDELLLRVRAAAVCGTDLRILKAGHFKIPEGSRRVLGHETAGEVVKVGSSVTGFDVGDRGAALPNVGCGHCRWCLKGLNQLCPDYEALGISYDGGFQEYMRVPGRAIQRGNIIKIPASLSYVEAALLEPFSCAYNASESLRTAPGDTVLIVGTGPIGACHVMISRVAGASRIIVAGRTDARLELSLHFGADFTVNTSRTDLGQAVMELTDGVGADVIITACSVPEVQAQALELAARGGRVNFFGGLPRGQEIVPLNTNLIHYKELQVGATTGSSVLDFHQSMRIVASGKLRLADLATGLFRLDQIHQAFDYAAGRQGMKAVVVMDD
ncbi:MAG: alcohol dehydrogenase catalytic domain-containing protein [Christensenellaceae bacterium]|nr:alcohol dehydrogenase catalytic domain-containing protein [Christensenellaceae bacterium]